MKKQNVIDLDAYREQQDATVAAISTTISDELKEAIQQLIDKMRTQEPNNPVDNQ